MNCAEVRQQLLACERPDRPGPEAATHLADCPGCQEWLRRLVRLERKITQLTVPESGPPVAFLRQLADAPAGPLLHVPLAPSADTRRVREGGRQKLALALALAATLTLFTLAWWAWPPRPDPETPPGLPYPRLVEQRLRNATSPEQRLAALAGLSEELLAEVRTLAEQPDAAALLASHFERLVQTDLFEAARTLPGTERGRLLPPIVTQLERAESTASRLASAWEGRHLGAAPSLRKIAASAREAERRLRLLL